MDVLKSGENETHHDEEIEEMTPLETKQTDEGKKIIEYPFKS